MNSRYFKILAGLAFGSLSLGGVCAAAESNPWSLALYAGDADSGSGKFRSPTQASIANLGTYDPKLAGASGSLALDRLDYHEAYHNRFSAALELGYALNENLQAFGRFGYDARQGREQDIGSLASARFANPQRVIAHFGNSDSRGLEVGARYLWLASERWRPYVALSVGATRTDDMDASLNVPGTAINLSKVRFARSGSTFSQSFETGVEFNPIRQFGVRFSVRANHIGTPPSGGDPQLTALGFDSGNDAGNRVDYPIALAAVYHFD
jgi:hypothetical protein